MNIIDQAHADNVALRERVKELEAALALMLKANFGCGCCMDPVAVGEALTAAEKALGTAP